MLSEPAKRIANHGAIDDHSVCYWKNNRDGHWYIYLPSCESGSLANHTIEEHEDGTISVTPSIVLNQRHGFLIKGVWNDA